MDSNPPPSTTPRQRSAIRWTLMGLLALVFLASGVSKLLSVGSTAQDFQRWGYPDGFQYVVGAMELSAAFLLVAPRIRAAQATGTFWAAAGLGGLMVGAVATHVRVREYAQAVVPASLLALAVVLAWLERPAWVQRLVRAAPRGDGSIMGRGGIQLPDNKRQ